MIETQRLRPDEAGLETAASLLSSGKLVAFPTETVYGLGADARDGMAVAEIYAAKGRPSFNPLIVHVSSMDAALDLADIPAELIDLGRAFWPGPLTSVAPLRAGSGLSELVSAGLPSVALRVPEHALARRLLDRFGGPIAAPSANPSGQISPTTADHVLGGLSGKIAAVLDGGPCEVGLESTILTARDGEVFLLRSGGLPQEAIEAAIGAPLSAPATGKIEAPGQLSSHYAPQAGLRLNVEHPSSDEAYLAFGNGADLPNCLDLSRSEDMREAAANLFAHLRELDRMVREHGLSGIAAAPIPDHGLGLAINDRLTRAAAPRN